MIDGGNLPWDLDGVVRVRVVQLLALALFRCRFGLRCAHQTAHGADTRSGDVS